MKKICALIEAIPNIAQIQKNLCHQKQFAPIRRIYLRCA